MVGGKRGGGKWLVESEGWKVGGRKRAVENKM